MSLLLDALNRASLDKAALASAAQAQAGKKAIPAKQLEPTPPGTAADVSADVPTGATPLGFADAVSPAWPSLEQSTLKAVPDATVELLPTAATSEPLSPGMFDLSGAQAALSLAPRLQEPDKPDKPDKPALPEFASLADPLPIPDLVPLVAPQTAATTAAPTEASFSRMTMPPAFEAGPAASETGSMPPGKSPTASDARPQPMPGNGNGNRVAQNLLRAKRPPTAKSRTRVMVLASVAVALVLATAMGAVFLGALGDPLVLAQNLGLVAPQQPLAPPSGSLTPTQVADSAMPAVATVEPATNNVVAAAAQSPNPAPPLPVSVAAARETVVAGSPGPAPSRPRMTMAVPVSSLACPPGTLPPDCKAADSTGDAGQGLQGSVQSRSSGPSMLEQGYSALTQGRLQEAQTVYLRVLKVNPEERDALLGMAYIAQKQQRPDDAQAYYRRVLRQEPDNAVARAGLLALNSLSNSQEFGSQSRLLAEQNPASAAAQSMLGHALVRQDRLADAQLAFAKALQLEPGVARHAFNLAVALDRLHDYDAAQRYYERAVALLAQSGGERASGFALADVQLRLAQLRLTE